ncbi:MAG: hypothetical protein AB7K41_11150 [Bdellovibrionales bacterium]
MLTPYPINLRKFGDPPTTTGVMEVYQFNSRERVLRATKFFFGFLGLAFVSVLIPVLHFILVPLFSFLAPASALFVFTQLKEVRSANGTCPYCQQTTHLPRAKVTLPFRDSCAHCRQLIEITAF